MKLTVEVPARQIEKAIKLIHINIEDNVAIVEIWHGGNRNRVEVDLNEILKGATKTQVETVKKFIRQIIAKALDMSEKDIPEILTNKKGETL